MTEIHKMLAEELLEIAEKTFPEFYSHILLVKTTGNWRPVIDFSPSNCFVEATSKWRWWLQFFPPYEMACSDICKPQGLIFLSSYHQDFQEVHWITHGRNWIDGIFIYLMTVLPHSYLHLLQLVRSQNVQLHVWFCFRCVLNAQKVENPWGSQFGMLALFKYNFVVNQLSWVKHFAPTLATFLGIYPWIHGFFVGPGVAAHLVTFAQDHHVSFFHGELQYCVVRWVRDKVYFSLSLSLAVLSRARCLKVHTFSRNYIQVRDLVCLWTKHHC